MIRPAAVLPLLLVLADCAVSHAPDFAARKFEPFTREDTVAIAMREWRLFGQPTEDEAPVRHSPPLPREKPERLPGLWERVGEYWWIGQNADAPESALTGKHDQAGKVFPASVDGDYAWSAAFISYVMRVAGAGTRFPYSPNHATYVNAAAAGKSPILRAHAPASYAPKPGDLVCRGREWARGLHFSDLPTAYSWPGHCDIVAAAEPGRLSVIGGNVNDAVTMTHIPVTQSGTLAETQPPWLAVLEVIYDAEAEPEADQ